MTHFQMIQSLRKKNGIVNLSEMNTETQIQNNIASNVPSPLVDVGEVKSDVDVGETMSF